MQDLSGLFRSGLAAVVERKKVKNWSKFEFEVEGVVTWFCAPRTRAVPQPCVHHSSTHHPTHLPGGSTARECALRTETFGKKYDSQAPRFIPCKRYLLPALGSVTGSRRARFPRSILYPLPQLPCPPLLFRRRNCSFLFFHHRSERF